MWHAFGRKGALTVLNMWWSTASVMAPTDLIMPILKNPAVTSWWDLKQNITTNEEVFWRWKRGWIIVRLLTKPFLTRGFGMESGGEHVLSLSHVRPGRPVRGALRRHAGPVALERVRHWIRCAILWRRRGVEEFYWHTGRSSGAYILLFFRQKL